MHRIVVYTSRIGLDPEFRSGDNKIIGKKYSTEFAGDFNIHRDTLDHILVIILLSIHTCSNLSSIFTVDFEIESESTS